MKYLFIIFLISSCNLWVTPPEYYKSKNVVDTSTIITTNTAKEIKPRIIQKEKLMVIGGPNVIIIQIDSFEYAITDLGGICPLKIKY